MRICHVAKLATKGGTREQGSRMLERLFISVHRDQRMWLRSSQSADNFGVQQAVGGDRSGAFNAGDPVQVGELPASLGDYH